MMDDYKLVIPAVALKQTRVAIWITATLVYVYLFLIKWIALLW